MLSLLGQLRVYVDTIINRPIKKQKISLAIFFFPWRYNRHWGLYFTAL